jgi:hypothetical protein
VDELTLIRFWQKVNKVGPIPAHAPELGHCWEWIACRGHGYGSLTIKRRRFPAHRVSFAIAHGRVPDGLLVLHRCDNRACVNPGHLYAGTLLDNSRDAVERGRLMRGPAHQAAMRRVAARGEKHGSKTRPRAYPELEVRGEDHGNAKLTESDVLAIRAARQSGETLRSIGERFGVTLQQVHNIAKRKSWAHV